MILHPTCDCAWPLPIHSVRKQIKIRPGFTPQEDVSRFRGTRQTQADANTLPKGHILGWVAPSSAAAATSNAAKSKSAKKNEKRKEKRKEKAASDIAAKIKENWDDDDEDEAPPKSSTKTDSTAKKDTKQSDGDALADKLDKLEVR